MDGAARELFKQVQMRRSNFQYNLNLLERRRKLREVCDYVDSLVGQSSCLLLDSSSDAADRLRARRLIHEQLQKADDVVLKNVTEKRQKMEEGRKQIRVGPQATKSRLYLDKDDECVRCAKKKLAESRSAIACVKPKSQKTVGGSVKSKGGAAAPRRAVMVSRPSHPFANSEVSSARRLRIKCLAQSLKDKLRESASMLDRSMSNDRVFIPLGRCQKNVVLQSTKGTNTSPNECDGRVSIETVVRADADTRRKGPRTLSVRLLPGVSVPSEPVISFAPVKLHSSYKYVELLESEDVAPNPNDLLASVRTENVEVIRPLSSESGHCFVRPSDETPNRLDAARQWLEQELVEYVLSQISLDESRTSRSTSVGQEDRGVANEQIAVTEPDLGQVSSVSGSDKSTSSRSSSPSISVPWIPSPDGTQTLHSIESGIPNPEPTPLDAPELPKDEEEGERVLLSSKEALKPESPPYFADSNPIETPTNRFLIDETNSAAAVPISGPLSPVSPLLPVSEARVESIKDNVNDVSRDDTSADPVTDSKAPTTVSQSGWQDVSIGQVISIRQLRNVAYNRQRRQWISMKKNKSHGMLDASVASTLDGTDELSTTDPSSTVLSEGEVRPVCRTGELGSTVLWHRVGPSKNFFAVANSQTGRPLSTDKSLGEVAGVPSTSYQDDGMLVDSRSLNDDVWRKPGDTTDPLSEGEVGSAT